MRLKSELANFKPTYITYHAVIIRDTNGNPSCGPSRYTECHIVSLHTVTGLVVSTLSREISKALGWRGGRMGCEWEVDEGRRGGERERKGKLWEGVSFGKLL